MKMNKMTAGMFAMASMLLATSCSNDDLQGMGANGNFVTARFNVTAPEGMKTRTIGDGETVNKVVCATYDAKGVEMTDLRQYLEIKGKQAPYSIRLAKGQNYRVAFFAYYDADGDNMPEHYNIADLKNIEILGNQLSNVEQRDAFTAYYDIEHGATMQPIEKDITLYRPFAQLNLGSYKEDWAAAVSAGVTVKQTQVTVSNVYNAFSAYDDAVVGETSEVTFALNELPANGYEWLYADVDLNGTPEEYKYLALNYLLVGDKNNEKNLTDIKFTWSTADGKSNDPVTEFKNIPVQRNYRTNILGWLLTNPAVFNITIDERFEELDSPYEDDYNLVAIDGTVSTEELAESGYTDFIDNGATEVDVIENVHITAEATAIVVNDVKAASGTLCVANSKINAKTLIELNDYFTVVFDNCRFTVEELVKINTSNTAYQFIFNNCYLNNEPMVREKENQYFSSEFLSVNTVNIYFNEEAEDDNTGNEGNEGEGDNTGNEGEDDNTGNEGEGDNTGNEGEGDNTGGEGEGDNTGTTNFSAIFEGLPNSTSVPGAKYLSDANYSEFVLDSPDAATSLHIVNSTIGKFTATTNKVTLFLENVTFTDEVDLSAMEGYTLYVSNCTVKGTKVTSSNLKSLMKYNYHPIGVN